MRHLLTVAFALYTAVLIACTGCDNYERSATLTEDAVVTDLIYTPPVHGSGSGISTGGDFTFTSIEVQPVWGVVFECQHGNFVSQGSDSRHQRLWAKLPKGSKVRVSYQELYRVPVEKPARRILTGYDFLDAEVVK